MINIPLNPLDHLPPHNYTASVLYLSLKHGVSTEDAFLLLQEGLHRTFLQLPWLSGTVCEQSAHTPAWRPGQLEIRYQPVDVKDPWPYQLRFNQLPTHLSYDDLKESAFPTDTFDDSDLTWAPFMPDIKRGCEVFVAQANFLPGGVILVGGLHHTAGDGNASFMVINRWADHCKALQGQGNPPTEPLPRYSDHSLHDRIWAEEGTGTPWPQIDPEVWRLTGLEHADADLLAGSPVAQPLPKPSDHESRQDPEASGVDNQQRNMRSAIFYISPSNFTTLQKECVKEVGLAAQISGTHAICGLVWRCLMKARATVMAGQQSIQLTTRSEEVARMDVLLDGRSGFSNSLPQMYLGNHTFHLQSSMVLSALTSPSTSIPSVAGMVCDNMRSRVDSAKLQDMYTLLRDMPSYDALQRRKWQPQMKSVSGSRMMITSMLMVPSDRVSFGDGVFGSRGKPDGARVLMGAFNRSGTRLCFLLPRLTNGGVEFIVNLSSEEMDALLEDEEFERYAMFLA